MKLQWPAKCSFSLRRCKYKHALWHICNVLHKRHFLHTMTQYVQSLFLRKNGGFGAMQTISSVNEAILSHIHVVMDTILIFAR